jgi:hypothetical protein
MRKSMAFLNDHNSGDCVDDVKVVAIAPMTAGIGFEDVSLSDTGTEGMGSVAGMGAGAGRVDDLYHVLLYCVSFFTGTSASSFSILFPVLSERSPFMTPSFFHGNILSTEPLQPRYEFLTPVACYTKIEYNKI